MTSLFKRCCIALFGWGFLAVTPVLAPEYNPVIIKLGPIESCLRQNMCYWQTYEHEEDRPVLIRRLNRAR